MEVWKKIFQPAVSWMFWLKTCGMNECGWRHAEQSWSSRRKKSKRNKAPPVLITEIEGTLNGFVKGNFKYFASKTILPWKVFFRSSKVVMSFQRHLIAFVTLISTRGKTYVQFERHYCTDICRVKFLKTLPHFSQQDFLFKRDDDEDCGKSKIFVSDMSWL